MLKKLEGVEIFSVGCWNGDDYDEGHLDEMVKAFAENKATFKPPLKLGHDENQKILQNDGYPAAGWVGNVYRVGEKLLADFIDIPEKIFKLLEKGAYKKVSSEVYWGIEVGEKKYDRMLAGVALLGADMPAVLNLNDIMEFYVRKAGEKKFYTNQENVPTLKTYKFQEERMDEIQKLQEQIKELQKTVSENSELKAYKADAESKIKEANQKIAELESSNQDTILEKNVTDISAELGLSVAMRPYVKALIGAEKKSYKVGDKELTKVDLLANVLKLYAEVKKLNTKEKTIDGSEITQSPDADEKIREYMKKHNVTYDKAYRVIMKSN